MRYLMTFSYDGKNYNGYQIQKNKPSIQEEIEKVLSKILNEKTKISASGRTDAKVHALNQKAHFDSNKEINISKLKNSLNKMLPSDIYIKQIKIVDDLFHARYTEKKKEYMYKINCLEYSPIDANYIYQYNHELDINNMKKAIKQFVGEHDFTSFTSSSGKKENMVRIIYDAYIEYENGILSINFIGNGFLQYMVRNMVGFLIEIGEGKRKVEDVKKVLELKDRKYAAKTAPPIGLYLKDVIYNL